MTRHTTDRDEALEMLDMIGRIDRECHAAAVGQCDTPAGREALEASGAIVQEAIATLSKHIESGALPPAQAALVFARTAATMLGAVIRAGHDGICPSCVRQAASELDSSFSVGVGRDRLPDIGDPPSRARH